jgi:hypothetical protein
VEETHYAIYSYAFVNIKLDIIISLHKFSEIVLLRRIVTSHFPRGQLSVTREEHQLIKSKFGLFEIRLSVIQMKE